MARPFSNYRSAVTDPRFFFGRADMLKAIAEDPFRVRVLLGGRRFGKTSLLRAVEARLLELDSSGLIGFPLLVSLEIEQPGGLDHFRYIVIERLRSAMIRWQEALRTEQAGRRQSVFLRTHVAADQTSDFINLISPETEHSRLLSHEQFRDALVRSIAELESFGFYGVTLMLDEAEFIVRNQWAGDVWSYLRGLKDSDLALSPMFGLILAGYRDLSEYQQRVGSPLLNIADVQWLTCLATDDVRAACASRARTEDATIDDGSVDDVINLSGGHPFVMHQIINSVFDEGGMPPMEVLAARLDRDFAAWWNSDNASDGFSIDERTVYRAIGEAENCTVGELARRCRLSRLGVVNSLQILAGTGVVGHEVDTGVSRSGGLFAAWVELADPATTPGS